MNCTPMKPDSGCICCMVVNHTVRLSGLQFSNGPGGPAQRVNRSTEAAPKLFYISRETHHSIEACCEE